MSTEVGAGGRFDIFLDSAFLCRHSVCLYFANLFFVSES